MDRSKDGARAILGPIDHKLSIKFDALIFFILLQEVLALLPGK